MKKSVYSLVLSDAVVAAVDETAYRLGVSRSALINKILAEAVSYVTPEQRMQDVFRAMESLFGGDLYQRLPQPSESMFSLRAPLAYKYNPTVKYSLELFRGADADGNVGVLRISLRSTNATLLTLLSHSFSLWAALELHYTGAAGAVYDGARFEKPIRPARPISEEALGHAIAAYIEAIEGTMNGYFRAIGSGAEATVIENGYRAYLSQCNLSHEGGIL